MTYHSGVLAFLNITTTLSDRPKYSLGRSGIPVYNQEELEALVTTVDVVAWCTKHRSDIGLLNQHIARVVSHMSPNDIDFTLKYVPAPTTPIEPQRESSMFLELCEMYK